MTHRTDEQKCPNCGALEVEAATPQTVYECGSSDYDQRPGTFKDACSLPHTLSSDWERSMSLGDMAEIYETEGLLGIQKLHESIIHTHIENARREERERLGICLHVWGPCPSGICTSDLHNTHCTKCGKHGMTGLTNKES